MPILILSDASLAPNNQLDSGAPRSPVDMLRRASLSANELVLTAVRTALERHPSFGRKLGVQLVPPQLGRSLSAGATGGGRSILREPMTQTTGPPRLFSRSYWGSRTCGRHTFYVVISLALLAVASQQLRLQRFTKEQNIVVQRELRRKGGPFEALTSPAVRNALTAQGALIAVNIFLAFRGVQIWQLIQKVKVIEILHRVGWLDPLTRRGAGVIRGLTMPMRSALRGLNAPGRAVGKALAERKADDLALEMLRLSRARTWRPLSAPITTAWRVTGKAGGLTQTITGEGLSAVSMAATGAAKGFSRLLPF